MFKINFIFKYTFAVIFFYISINYLYANPMLGSKPNDSRFVWNFISWKINDSSHQFYADFTNAYKNSGNFILPITEYSSSSKKFIGNNVEYLKFNCGEEDAYSLGYYNSARFSQNTLLRKGSVGLIARNMFCGFNDNARGFVYFHNASYKNGIINHFGVVPKWTTIIDAKLKKIRLKIFSVDFQTKVVKQNNPAWDVTIDCVNKTVTDANGVKYNIQQKTLLKYPLDYSCLYHESLFK